jgi:hypothetical protein
MPRMLAANEMQSDQLLPHLAAAARQVRVEAQGTYGQIGVYVRKRNGRTGVADSTISRFERGVRWPEDPDAMLRAYATAAGVSVIELWRRAVEAAATACGQATC